MTALMWAADGGNLEVLKQLIDHKAYVNARDENGLTALLWAADRGHLDCVKALIAAKADIDAVDKVGADSRIICL